LRRYDSAKKFSIFTFPEQLLHQRIEAGLRAVSRASDDFDHDDLRIGVVTVGTLQPIDRLVVFPESSVGEREGVVST